jgi:dCMP deaminase
MSRPSRDQVFLRMVNDFRERSTCARRQVACILVNARGHQLASGYNGVPSGWPHCTDVPCGGAHHATTQGLDDCEAIHAEQNALLQCPDVYKIDTCYVTDSPCVHCVKLLLNTSCKRIVASTLYSEKAKELWLRDGRQWDVP